MKSRYAACCLAPAILLMATPARTQPATPQVSVSAPVQPSISEYRKFTGQFSAIAVVDRLVHNATRIELTGESLRRKRSRNPPTLDRTNQKQATTNLHLKGSEPGDIIPEHWAT